MSTTPSPLDQESPSLNGRPKRVLLIDDSITLRLALRHQLSQVLPGCEVLEAADGREALRYLTTTMVDLIVTDLQMPGMDGTSLLQLLHRNRVLRRKPVLVVSSQAELSAGLDWPEESPLCRLSKPVSLERLRRAVDELLLR